MCFLYTLSIKPLNPKLREFKIQNTCAFNSEGVNKTTCYIICVLCLSLSFRYSCVIFLILFVKHSSLYMFVSLSVIKYSMIHDEDYDQTTNLIVITLNHFKLLSN